MKLKWLIIIGVLTIIVATCAMIPATLIEVQINERLKNTGVFRVTGGTIWSGQGTLQLKQGRTHQMAAFISWSFAPTSLLSARLGVDVAAAGADVNGRARIAFGLVNAKITNTDIATTFEVVNRFSPFLLIMRTSGEVQLRAGETPFTLGYATPHATSGTLKATVSKLKVRTLGGDDIGRFAATLTFDKQNTAYNIDDSNGLLRLSGGGNISRSSPREFRYVGSAVVSRATPAWLTASLMAVGRPSLDGRIQLDYKVNF